MKWPVLCLPLLVLSGCDKPDYSEPVRPVPVIGWDEARGDFLVDGEPATTARTWTGPAGVEVINAKGAPVSGGALSIADAAADPGLRMTLDEPLKGAEGPLVLVRLTRVRAAGPWDGSIFYRTAWHGESARFTVRPVSEPATGAPVTLVYDMSRPTAGGRDWWRSTIRRLRIDLEADGGGEVIIHRISIVRNPQ